MTKFIVIDGTDGCGKATQVKLLGEKLEQLGYRVVKMDFPNYDSDSSAAVKMYLNGELGENASELNPYMCGSFYAVDRFINYTKYFKKYFENESEDGRDTIVISDRYLSANIIHQASKIADRKERRKYIRWCYEFECEEAGMPVEDLTLILTVPAEVSQKLMSKRYNGNEAKKDIHEKDVKYLSKCIDLLKEAVDYTQYITVNNKKVNWKLLDCSDGDSIKPIEQISDEILDLVLNTIKA